MFSLLYKDIIYRPLLNALVFFYNIIPGHDIGIVIVLVTLLIRLILAPSMQKSLKGQKQMNDLQPKLNEVREKYKDNKEAQAKAIMELYKEHKDQSIVCCSPYRDPVAYFNWPVSKCSAKRLAADNLTGTVPLCA